MFRMDNKTKEILNPTGKEKTAAERRQLVYKAIIEDNTITENKKLAEAAGYDMSTYGTHDYFAGFNFINRTIRQGYIDKQIGRDGKEYFYITGKEPVLCNDNFSTKVEKIPEEPQSLIDARDAFAKEIAEYEPTLEEEDSDPVYSGSLCFHTEEDENSLRINFSGKTKDEIIEIISNLNLEEIL